MNVEAIAVQHAPHRVELARGFVDECGCGAELPCATGDLARELIRERGARNTIARECADAHDANLAVAAHLRREIEDEIYNERHAKKLGDERGALYHAGAVAALRQLCVAIDARSLDALEKLRAALRPFADFPDRPGAPDNEILTPFAWSGDATFEPAAPGYVSGEAALSVGDLRRARAALLRSA